MSHKTPEIWIICFSISMLISLCIVGAIVKFQSVDQEVELRVLRKTCQRGEALKDD